MFDMTALPPFEECPIILSEAEYETFKNMIDKKPKFLQHHAHKWVVRKGRLDSFLIVHDDNVERMDIWNGRYCTKCRRVEFGCDTDGAPVWTQKDMMALGFNGGSE